MGSFSTEAFDETAFDPDAFDFGDPIITATAFLVIGSGVVPVFS